jgi:hypothetical protein
MSNLFSRVAMRVAYGVSQLPRVAWYVGHSLAVRRLADATRPRTGAPKGRGYGCLNIP